MDDAAANGNKGEGWQRQTFQGGPNPAKDADPAKARSDKYVSDGSRKHRPNNPQPAGNAHPAHQIKLKPRLRGGKTNRNRNELSNSARPQSI